MRKLKKSVLTGGTVAVMLVAYVAVQTTVGEAPSGAAPAEPPPPKGQIYIGAKRCAVCHFDQFLKWKKTKHAKTFTLLPEKYQQDAKCLKCHTTGYGEPTGYKNSSDSGLKGTTCEVCHGPGSKHEDIAWNYVRKKLSVEKEKIVRDSIWKIQPKNVCVGCHVAKGHHESETPQELRTK